MRRKPRRCWGFQRGGPTPSFWKSLFKTSFSRADQLTQSLRIQTWWACVINSLVCFVWSGRTQGGSVWPDRQLWEGMLFGSSADGENYEGSPGRRDLRHRLDGMWHNWIPASNTSHCQWCYYKLHNVYDEKDRKHFRKALQQNWEWIQRRLVCHVHLCPVCDNDFYHANFSAYLRVNMP